MNRFSRSLRGNIFENFQYRKTFNELQWRENSEGNKIFIWPSKEGKAYEGRTTEHP